MATFIPRNRYLKIQRQPSVEDTVEDLGLVLPTSYEAPKSTHEVVYIVEISPDPKPSFYQGQRAVVVSQMIEDIEVEGEIVSVVLENYVIGVLSDTDSTA